MRRISLLSVRNTYAHQVAVIRWPRRNILFWANNYEAPFSNRVCIEHRQLYVLVSSSANKVNQLVSAFNSLLYWPSTKKLVGRLEIMANCTSRLSKVPYFCYITLKSIRQVRHIFILSLFCRFVLALACNTQTSIQYSYCFMRADFLKPIKKTFVTGLPENGNFTDSVGMRMRRIGHRVSR
jgi:hypothetical protein